MFRVLALLLLFPINAIAWEVRPAYKDESGFTLIKRESKVSELGAAIDKEARILRGLSLGRIMHIDSSSIQRDLLNYLKKHSPEKLEAALLFKRCGINL